MTEKDITRVLDRAILRKKQNEIVIDEQVVKVSLKQVKCNLLDTGKILIQGIVKREDNQDNKNVSLEIKPEICRSGQGIIIDEIYLVDFEGKKLLPQSIRENKKQLKVDISNITDGVYILNLRSDNRVNKIKVIIDKKHIN